MKVKNKICWCALYFLFLCLMIFISYIWSEKVSICLFGDGCSYFKNTRWSYIKTFPYIALREEFRWRFLPIFTLSAIVFIVKNKQAKSVIKWISAIIILIFQIQFGDIVHKGEPCRIIIQGGAGIIFAVAYVIALWFTYKSITINNKCIRFLVAHIIAIVTSTCVHATMNTLIVLRFTY